MNTSMRLALALACVLAVAGCNASSATRFTPSSGAVAPQGRPKIPQWISKGLARPACPQVPGVPTCLVLIESKSGVNPAGGLWKPIDFQTAYHLPSKTNGAGQVVAVIMPFDNPNVASDLATYRNRFGLGKAKFYKYNQDGQQSNYPQGNKYWGIPIDLDVEMVSAVCPKCTIYLVEANSQYVSDLSSAIAEAVTLGAHIVNMSWLCYGSISCFNPSTFDAPGVVYVAASGTLGYDDNGAPEDFANVVSVGGTVLFKHGKSYSEKVWDGSGGGCSSNGGSTGIPKPKWQKDPDCAYRTDADVSIAAWNAVEYDSYDFSGWFAAGGTGMSAPLIAGIFGLAENASKQKAGSAFWRMPESRRAKVLNYISSGEDGVCEGEYLCQAGTKQFGTYSGPAGWGTPNGVGAF